MKKISLSVLLSAAFLLSLGQLLPDSLRRYFAQDAEAIIGMPWTPLSVAGVARRSMYREAVYSAAAANAAAANAAAANMAYANAVAAQAAAANAAAANANAAAAAAAAQRAAASLPIGTTVLYLPPNCSTTMINGVNYFNCSGVFYRAGFQGNNIVYIVSLP